MIKIKSFIRIPQVEIVPRVETEQICSLDNFNFHFSYVDNLNILQLLQVFQLVELFQFEGFCWYKEYNQSM